MVTAPSTAPPRDSMMTSARSSACNSSSKRRRGGSGSAAHREGLWGGARGLCSLYWSLLTTLYTSHISRIMQALTNSPWGKQPEQKAFISLAFAPWPYAQTQTHRQTRAHLVVLLLLLLKLPVPVGAVQQLGRQCGSRDVQVQRSQRVAARKRSTINQTKSQCHHHGRASTVLPQQLAKGHVMMCLVAVHSA